MKKNIKVNFFSQIPGHKISNITKLKSYVKYIIDREAEEKKPHQGTINYILCSDEELLQMNKKYLNHDTLTDILTFEDYDKMNQLVADIYISLDRAIENARMYKQEPVDELLRLYAHGALHICGYKDATEKQQKLMRSKEDQYIYLYYNEI